MNTNEYTDTQSVIDGLLAECATGKAKSRTIWESRGKGMANGKPAEIIMLELGPAKAGCKMDTHGRIRVAARCIPGLQAKGATRHIIAEKAIGETPTETGATRYLLVVVDDAPAAPAPVNA